MPQSAKNRLGEIQALRELLLDSSGEDISCEFRALLKILKALPQAQGLLEFFIDPDLLEGWQDLVETGNTAVLTEIGTPNYIIRELAGDPSSLGMMPVYAGLAKREILAIMRMGGRYNARVGIDGGLALFALEKAATEGRPVPTFLMLPLVQTLYRACAKGGESGFRSIARLFGKRKNVSAFDDKELWMWQVLDYLLSCESEEYSAKEIEDSFPDKLKVRPSRAQIVNFCCRWGCRCRPT